MKRIIPKEIYFKEGSIVSANGRANMINLAYKDSFNRLLLCASAQKQFVPIENPEPPRIDSLYTAGLCYESSHNITYDKDLKVLKVLDKYIFGEKTSMRIVLLTDDKKNLYTHIHQDFISMAEDYGYKNDGAARDLNEGDILSAETFIQKPDIFSPYGLCWGKNAYTCYNISGHTLEDAARMSKRFADNMKLCKVMPMTLILGHRDRLKNLYGDEKFYKPFPLIGECVRDDKLVCGIERIEKNAQLLTSPKMLVEFAHNDIPKYISAGSKCIDIDVFASSEDIISNEFIKEIYKECRSFYLTFLDTVNEYIYDGYIPDFYTEYYHDYYKSLYIDNTGFMQPSGHNVYSIDTYIVESKFQKYAPLEIGQKITGMHGNKGVVSDIVDGTKIYEVYETYDLVTESGIMVDIVLNTPGVPNRSNMGQTDEKFINNHLDGIIRYHKDPDRQDLNMMYTDLMYLLKFIAPECHDMIDEMIKNGEDKKKYMLDILENDFCVLTNPWPEECHHPIYRMNSAERLEKIYQYFNNKPEYKGYIGKERLYVLEADGTKTPTNIIAEVSRMYFIPLEYTAEKKFGARTRGHYDRMGGLAKTTRKKERTHQYAETPIKLGTRDLVIITSVFREQSKEALVNFMLATDSEIIETFKAFLGQIQISIEYSKETIDILRKIVHEELRAAEKEDELDL